MSTDKIASQFVESIVRQVESSIKEQLENINHSSFSNDRSLNIADASNYLGVSDKTLYLMCKKKQIPHRRFGSKIVFSLASLDAWGREQDKLNYQPEGVRK
nr:helix-turn-helix domain-containing protein [Paenibacillus xylanexedens]